MIRSFYGYFYKNTRGMISPITHLEQKKIILEIKKENYIEKYG